MEWFYNDFGPFTELLCWFDSKHHETTEVSFSNFRTFSASKTFSRECNAHYAERTQPPATDLPQTCLPSVNALSSPYKVGVLSLQNHFPARISLFKVKYFTNTYNQGRKVGKVWLRAKLSRLVSLLIHFPAVVPVLSVISLSQVITKFLHTDTALYH